MVVRYEMTGREAVKAYWYRWQTSGRFRAGVLAFGLVPATLVFSLTAAAVPRVLWAAALAGAVVEALSPLLFATLMQQMSRRGPRTLAIDADGLTSAVGGGQWEVGWDKIHDIAVTPEFIFILGRGINSVAVPTAAFADAEERDEFVRRARRWLSA